MLNQLGNLLEWGDLASEERAVDIFLFEAKRAEIELAEGKSRTRGDEGSSQYMQVLDGREWKSGQILLGNAH